jgi:hypothetical protein
MTEEKKSTINPDWEHYYKTLEAIRRSGVTNMYGAAPYLAAYANIDERLASQVLVNWMQNYDELSKKYDWRR